MKQMMTDDMELVRDYAAHGTESSFATLVSRYTNLVYSTALRQTRNAQLAEEVAQAVFIIFARKAGSLGPGTILPSWLYRTACFVSRSAVKCEMRRQGIEQEAYMQSTLDQSVSSWEHLAPLLDDGMLRLSESERDALVLRFFEGRNFNEVALAMGASEDAAKKRVSRALEKLRGFFGKHGVALSSAHISSAVSAHSIQSAPPALAHTITVLALTKGTAAGASTLTLIKGGLKIMAWSKTKTAIVAGVIALALGGVTPLAVKIINHERTRTAMAHMQGAWEGTIIVPTGAKLRVVLNITHTNGDYRVTADSIDQGAKGIPVESVSAHPGFFHFDMPGIGGAYDGKINPDYTAINGHWTQLGKKMALNLTRTDQPDQVPAAMPADEFAPRAGSDVQGTWQGTLKAGKMTLHLALRIAQSDDGTIQAQMDDPDQGSKNIPVASMTYEKPTLKFKMPQFNGSYTGKLDNTDGSIKGKWTQMGKTLPLTFARATTNDTAADQTQLDYGTGASYQVQGHWNGALKMGRTQLHIVFHIGLMPGGSYSATMDSPDQGASGIPATSVSFTYPNVKMNWDGIGGSFVGKLQDGKLNGKWTQGKVSLPLKMTRSAAN